MKIRIELGALCDPISDQLKGRAPNHRLRFLDGHAESITRLHIHGVLTDSECDKARKRLMRKIQQEVKASK